MADMGAFIRSLISPQTPLVQQQDIMSGARDWAQIHEQRRSNQENERLRERGQNVELEGIAQQRGSQQERLAFEREQASQRQAQELHDKQVKAAGELMDALASEDPVRINKARSNANLLGVTMEEEQPPEAPMSGVGPLSGPKEARPGTRMPQDASSGQGTGSTDPNALDEFGGRMLKPGERPEFAGDEQPPDWLQGYMSRPGKPDPFFAGEQRKPKPTVEPTNIPVVSEEMDKIRREVVLEEEKEPLPANAQDQEGPAGTQGTPGAQAQVKDATAQPPRQPVAERGYLLRANGQTLAHINAGEVKARQREMAAEALQPLFKHARNDFEKACATEAMDIATQQVGKIGLDNAIKAGQQVYDKRIAEKGKNERAQMQAWSRQQNQGFQQAGALEEDFNAIMRRYQTHYRISEMHDAIAAADRAAGAITSDNPAAQEQAVYEYVRSVNGAGVLSNQDFQRSTGFGGKWAQLQTEIGKWTNEGRRPEEWRQMLQQAQGLVREAQSARLHEVGKLFVDDVARSPSFTSAGPDGLLQTQKRGYSFITGSRIPTQSVAPATNQPQGNQPVSGGGSGKSRARALLDRARGGG